MLLLAPGSCAWVDLSCCLCRLWLNTLLGMLCFIAFCFLQRSVFPKHYRYRMVRLLQSNIIAKAPQQLTHELMCVLAVESGTNECSSSSSHTK
jgi:hypothetical protein